MNKVESKIIALLGPTNTGKTYMAIEKMLEFNSGIFGLPLRLLDREVYDKCVKKLGAEKVALITGEEKIIPNSAQFFICTVESMPKDKVVDFVAVDEIQMCGDRERGHIFTDRLLNFRGEVLTMFLGCVGPGCQNAWFAAFLPPELVGVSSLGGHFLALNEGHSSFLMGSHEKI